MQRATWPPMGPVELAAGAVGHAQAGLRAELPGTACLVDKRLKAPKCHVGAVPSQRAASVAAAKRSGSFAAHSPATAFVHENPHCDAARRCAAAAEPPAPCEDGAGLAPPQVRALYARKGGGVERAETPHEGNGTSGLGGRRNLAVAQANDEGEGQATEFRVADGRRAWVGEAMEGIAGSWAQGQTLGPGTSPEERAHSQGGTDCAKHERAGWPDASQRVELEAQMLQGEQEDALAVKGKASLAFQEEAAVEGCSRNGSAAARDGEHNGGGPERSSWGEAMTGAEDSGKHGAACKTESGLAPDVGRGTEGESADGELGWSTTKQLELAATPAHRGALAAMYWTYVCCCLWEKVWRFGLPAILSMLLPSMQPIALLSFFSQLVIFVAAPWVGQYMDSNPRVLAFNTLCTVQTVAMVVTALATIWVIRHPSSTSLSGGALLRQPWFLVVMAAGAVDKLTGLAAGVAFERDWVILLAGKNRPLALASANAMLRRVDLFCELAGPVSFGWLLSKFPPMLCLNTAIAVAVVSLPLLLLLVKVTDSLSKGALGRPRQGRAGSGSSASSLLTAASSEPSGSAQVPSMQKDAWDAGNGSSRAVPKGEDDFIPQSGLAISSQSFAIEEETHVTPHIDSSRTPTMGPPHSLSSGEARPNGASANQGTAGPLEAAWKGWQSFLGQSVLPASLAYVLLYFNAVLSPGGLMTSFLTQRGVDVSVIGAFRGACAAMGFAATFISAPLVRKLGVLHAGAGALMFQAGLLALSVAVFFWSRPHQHGLLMLFLALVVLSRLGHWVYDVVDAQIFQTAVPSVEANLVGTTEIALASLAELIMLGTAIVLHDVSNFGQLAVLSMASVVLAMSVYCVWLFRPNRTRDALFPDRPELAFFRKRAQRKGERANSPLQPGST